MLAAAPSANAASASFVRSFAPGSGLYALAGSGETLLSTASDGIHGYELWKSDGTAAGTKLVKDIYPGPSSSIPLNTTSVGGMFLFRANDGVHGTELWVSNGTAAGTRMVKDIRPGNGSSYPGDSLTGGWSPGFTDSGGTVYFNATDGHGQELWRTDGTAAGTRLVKDIRAGGASSEPDFLTDVGGTLFFAARDGVHGRELWRSDGTAAGTTMAWNLPGGSLDPWLLTSFGGKVFFDAQDKNHGYELWRSDATATGTRLVRDINPGAASSIEGFGYGDRLLDLDGKLYFHASDGTHGSELWRTNGTRAGTAMVRDINPGGAYSNPGGFMSASGTVLFSADDGIHGHELWRSDGTAAGTKLVRDVYPGSASSYPKAVTSIAGTVFLSADDGVNGWELWSSNGTTAGTRLVRDIGVLPTGTWYDAWGLVDASATVGGTLYFGANVRELWKAVP